MKLTFKILFVILMGILSYYSCFAEFYGAEFMDIKNAEKKWGTKTFDKKLFRETPSHKRASMAVDIVKRKVFIGTDMKQVRKEIGDPDSYFFSDTIYAYKIIPFPGKNKENWHLVFIPDENLEKVKDVKIHKKCCYKKPPKK